MDSITHAAMVLLRSGTPAPTPLAGSVVALLAASLRRRVAATPREVESGPVPGAVMELARVLDRHLADDERQLLAWLGDRIPRQEGAEWVGSSRGATRVRVLRLRERLRALTRQHAATLPPDERTRLERYLSAAPPRIPSPRRAEHS